MARPLSRPGLGSTTRRELCWHLAQGFSKEEAAKKAGLPDTYRLHQFARTKDFAAELQEAMRDHLQVNLSPKAVRILDEIMSDSKVTPMVRVQAAKTLLDRSGYQAGEQSKQRPLSEKGMEDMSIDELQELLRTLQRKADEEEARRANGAQDVTAEGEPELLLA